MSENKDTEKILKMQYCEEDFDELLKEMEVDSEFANYTIPEDWDREFRAAIKKGLQEQRTQKRKLRIKRVQKLAGMIAIVLLLVGVSGFSLDIVQGQGLLKIFKNKFTVNNTQYAVFGTQSEIEFSEEEEQDIICFKGDSIEDIYEQARIELKCPMFYLEYVPDGFVVEEATYYKLYRTMNIKLVNDESYIYIFQQQQIDEIASAIANHDGEIIKVDNSNLQKEIEIYENVQDKSWTLNVIEKETVFSMDAFIELEECVRIAENIRYY